METKKKTTEEKVKAVILEDIKDLANEAWCNPTDENICELFNGIEFLKKVLKHDSIPNINSISSPYITQPMPLGEPTNPYNPPKVYCNASGETIQTQYGLIKDNANIL